MKINIHYGKSEQVVEFAEVPTIVEGFTEKEILTLKERVTAHVKKNRTLYTTAVLIGISAVSPSIGFAAEEVGGNALIKLMQEGSFYIGIGVSIWGIIESQLGYAGWKGRVTNGVLGYIAILILPMVFKAIRSALFV